MSSLPAPSFGRDPRPSILGGVPYTWEQGEPDLHLLTLKVLARNKIIPLQEQEIDAALALPSSERSPIPGGGFVMPPFCVWGLPRSDQGKGKAGEEASTVEAPRLWFLGVPLMGIKAAGLSMDLSESVAKADDPRWTHQVMQHIHARGGYIYGGLWSTVRWAQGRGVDTSDFQRVAEFAMDELARLDPYQLRTFLTGQAEAKVAIRSQAQAERLITGFYASSREAGAEERKDHKESKSFVLDQLAHPEFTVLTTAHRGTDLVETLASFRIFGATSQITGARGARGWELSVSPVAVALAAGMAARLGRIVSSGSRTFDPEGVGILLDWLNKKGSKGLNESGRRLARHLLLSQGERGSYAYLKEPFYAAAVLGHRLTEDRRSRAKVAESLESACQSILEALEGLRGLLGAHTHLTRALESLGFSQAPKTPKVVVVAPSLGLLEAEDAPSPEVVAPAPQPPETGDATSENQGHDLHKSGTRPPQIRDTTSTYQGRDLHISGTRPPHIRDTTSTYQGQGTTYLADFEGGSTPPIRYNSTYSTINSFHQSVSRESGAGGAQNPDGPSNRKSRTDGLTDFSDSFGQENKTPSEGVKFGLPEGTDLPGEIKDPDAYIQSVLLPPPSGKTMGRPENRLRHWDRPLKEAVGKWLFTTQMCDLETDCRWTPEGVWAILEGIRVEGARLNKPGATLWGALRVPLNGRKWLMKTGPLLREAGWRDLPEDGTPREDQERRLAGGRIAPFHRLPLDEAGQARRAEILREVAQEQAAASATLAESRRRPSGGPEAAETEEWRLWSAIQAELGHLLPSRSFEDWIQPCQPIGYYAGMLSIRVPNTSAKIWIEQQMIDEFQAAIDQLGLEDLRIQFVV